MSNSSQPHGLQHARLPCPSLSPGVCSSSCPFNTLQILLYIHWNTYKYMYFINTFNNKAVHWKQAASSWILFCKDIGTWRLLLLGLILASMTGLLEEENAHVLLDTQFCFLVWWFQGLKILIHKDKGLQVYLKISQLTLQGPHKASKVYGVKLQLWKHTTSPFGGWTTKPSVTEALTSFVI